MQRARARAGRGIVGQILLQLRGLLRRAAQDEPEAEQLRLLAVELLELLLFSAIPRRDTKPTAKLLLARFGSFAALYGVKNTAKLIRDGLTGKFLA